MSMLKVVTLTVGNTGHAVVELRKQPLSQR